MGKHKQSTDIVCRHCGRPTRPQGLWRHLRTHGIISRKAYTDELARHGVGFTNGVIKTKPLRPPPPPPPIEESGEIEESDSITLTREQARVALIGLDKLYNELGGNIADIKASLEPKPKPTPRPRVSIQESRAELKAPPSARYQTDENEALPTPKWITIGTSNKKVWSNDPEGKYCHDRKTGRFLLTKGGEPKLRAGKTNAQLKGLAKARAARWPKPAKQTPTKNGVLARRLIKMEYWPNGEPKYRANPDGSVKLTAKGQPWKKTRKEELRAAAYKSHVARGLKPASYLKKKTNGVEALQ